MEPDFIREQVKNVWRVVASNVKLIAEKKLAVEGAFVDPEFVLNQACSLYEAVTDSANMHAAQGRERQFVFMKPEFLSQQGKALQAVIEDSVQLQGNSRATVPALAGLGDKFVLELVESLREIVYDNAVAAREGQVQPNSLYMSRPDFVYRVVGSFHCVLSTYIQQREGISSLREYRLAAERACTESKAQVDAMAAEKAAAETRVTELETLLAALQSEADQLRADAKEAADAAEARVSKLEQALTSLSAAHLRCNPMVSLR
ncbi:hypothetical protein OH77DRAFT_409293 [Trametes cingulata]|nr:hypothetical protein OH77DRAFT_409293 [Trametes cingulata]